MKGTLLEGFLEGTAVEEVHLKRTTSSRLDRICYRTVFYRPPAGTVLFPHRKPKAAESLHHELGVSLRPRDDHVHPYPHGLGGGGHHVVDAVVGLHAEGQRRVRALKWEEKSQEVR